MHPLYRAPPPPPLPPGRGRIDPPTKDVGHVEKRLKSMKQGIAAGLLVTVGAFVYLSTLPGLQEYSHRFSSGDVVQTLLYGQIGTVVATRTYNDGVLVRFESLDVVQMHDFELVSTLNAKH